MIDPATGEIDLGAGLRVGAGFDEQAFLASPLGAKAEAQPAAKPWANYRVRYHARGGRLFSVVLRFDAGKLAMVQLVEIEDEGGGWDSWSEQKEIEKKARHDEWLDALLGPPPYRYSWGEITSEFDPRGGFSSIVVRYR